MRTSSEAILDGSKKSDFGPVERFRHGEEYHVEETIRAGVKRVRMVSFALDRYHSRGLLGDEADNERRHTAGIQFHSDAELCNMRQRVIANYEQRIPGPEDWQGIRLKARQRVEQALLAIGPIASNEVIEVCVMGNPVGRERMEILRRGLEQLARHYGY